MYLRTSGDSTAEPIEIANKNTDEPGFLLYREYVDTGSYDVLLKDSTTYYRIGSVVIGSGDTVFRFAACSFDMQIKNDRTAGGDPAGDVTGVGIISWPKYVGHQIGSGDRVFGKIEIAEGYIYNLKEGAPDTPFVNMRDIGADGYGTVADTEVIFEITENDFDTNPYLLKTTNQAYDLRTGETIRDISTYNITLSSPSRLPDYNTARCDRWYSFIDEIMSHDKDKAAFLQRALGYSILGVNKEECMFIAYGQKSRNGKGTLFSIIEKALGSDYCATVSPSLICESPRGVAPDFNSPQPILASLIGKRIVNMPEATRGVKLDAAAMKSLTGRDALTTRGLYEHPFSFTPQFTLWLNTNYLPAVNDEIVFRSDRVWVITFDEHFDETTRDINLKEYFAQDENLRTVLKWLVDGCIDYMQHGLAVPEVVRNATRRYHISSDLVGQFLYDCCVIDKKSPMRILRGDLYSAYRSWCGRADNRFKPYGSTTFYGIVEQHGFTISKYGGSWYVKGIEIKC